jgi:hypothetical protein
MKVATKVQITLTPEQKTICGTDVRVPATLAVQQVDFDSGSIKSTD